MTPDSSSYILFFYKFKSVLCAVIFTKCHTMISLKVAIALGCLSQPKASIEKALYLLCDTRPYPINLKMFCSQQAMFPDSAFVMYFCWSTFPGKQIKTKPKKHFVFFSTFIESFMIDQTDFILHVFRPKKQCFSFILSFNGLDQGTLTEGEGSVQLTSSLRQLD